MKEKLSPFRIHNDILQSVSARLLATSYESKYPGECCAEALSDGLEHFDRGVTTAMLQDMQMIYPTVRLLEITKKLKNVDIQQPKREIGLHRGTRSSLRRLSTIFRTSEQDLALILIHISFVNRSAVTPNRPSDYIIEQLRNTIIEFDLHVDILIHTLTYCKQRGL
jgi:hypothetical protein